MIPGDKVQSYLSKIDVPTEGGRNQALNAAAWSVVKAFHFSEGEFFSVMEHWAERINPRLPDSEVEKTLRSVWNAASSKGQVGSEARADHEPVKHVYTLNGRSPVGLQRSVRPDRERIPSQEQLASGNYDLSNPSPLPEPIEGGCRKLLMEAFNPSECVAICDEWITKDGRGVPTGKGICMERETWFERLKTRDDNPDRFFKREEGQEATGIFIRINPLSKDGSKDEHVTSFRHALLEFDNLSKEEQWQLITQSGIPATAVISSGRKSLHAWVRVDAANKEEYKERVAFLYKHFEQYGPDKVGNPSRFSRLPDVTRGEGRQALLALKIGAKTWGEWVAQVDLHGLGSVYTPSQLEQFDPENDPNNLLGARWICKGHASLLIGPSGIGKSSLAAQAAICWALGRSMFGICPSRPLKSLIVQAENDQGDLAEQYQGVIRGNEISADDRRKIESMIRWQTSSSKTGAGFVATLARLLDQHKPDLVWLDPMLAFVGDDISSQRVIADFCRNGLNPILQSTGTALIALHHTGKPPSDPKARKDWTSFDANYSGLGSSDMVNWARSVSTIAPIKGDDRKFHLRLGKRGERAKATSVTGTATCDVYLQWGSSGICWEQIAQPKQEQRAAAQKDEEKKRGRPPKKINWEKVQKSIKGEWFTRPQLIARVARETGRTEDSVARVIDYYNLLATMILDPENEAYSVV